MARPKARGKKAVAGKPAASASGSGKKAAAATSGKSASNKQKRSAANAKSSVKDVYSDDDDDEQEERMNAKMDIDGVYEYEQPETFENDSEIDEDEAFNSDDEQSYGSFFTAKESGKKQSASDDDDDATVEDDDDAAGGDLLSDLLGTAPAQRLSTKTDGDVSDNDDSALENSDDDDDAEPKNLAALAAGLVPERKKKKLVEIAADAGVLGGASAGGALTLSSLLGVGGDSNGADAAATAVSSVLNLTKVKKQVRGLETDGSAALQAAVAPVHEERAARKIAYAEKSDDVDLFQPVVRRNRLKETMDFREQTPKLENLTAASLTSKFAATTDMEKQVDALLKAGDLSDRAVAQDEVEELAAKKVSHAEVLARQAELAKMRALMFYDEQKAKRVKKIKSKLYHKIRNGQDKKAAEKQRAQLRELDPELADALDREMAEKRAEERMTLKHTNTSKWVTHQLQRGTLADNGTRKAIAEQLRRGDELRRKVQTAASDDDGDDDDDDEDDEEDDDDSGNAVTRLQKRLTKQADALVMEIRDDEAAASDATGLQGMKFMQRAVQKQREKARSEAEKLLRELKGDDDAGGLLSDGDAMSSDDDDGGRKAKAKASSTTAATKKQSTKKKKKRVVTAADEQAVAQALPTGALQTGAVSIDKGMAARSSGAIAVDLGDGPGSRVAAVGLAEVATASDSSSKTIELGATRKTTAAAATTETTASATEENPWLSGAASSTKSKKRNKKAASKHEASGADVASAIASLTKAVATGSDASGGTNSNKVNALAVLTGGNKGSKKRKLEQTSSAAIDADASGSTAEATPTGAAAAKKAKATAKASSAKTSVPIRDSNGQLTQEELVRRAFAFADADDDEIAREKDAIAAQDTTAKKGAEIAKLVGMTGWGTWAGDGVKTSYRQQARVAQAHKLAADTKAHVLASRKDAKMDRVLINEKKDKRAAKFAVKDVPYPFTSRAEYDMAMRNPLGADWNTPASTAALTVPKVIKRAGAIINPLALSKADKKEAKKELSKQRKAKF